MRRTSINRAPIGDLPSLEANLGDSSYAKQIMLVDCSHRSIHLPGASPGFCCQRAFRFLG